MVQISAGSPWGRIGTSFGQGLSEQIPKEIDRSRLASGLENLSQQKDLTPEQYFTKAAAIPGFIDRPELVRQFGEFARLKSQAGQLGNVPKMEDIFPGAYEQPNLASAKTDENYPTSTAENLYQKVTKGFTRMTPQQEEIAAAKEYARRAPYFKHDPTNALKYVQDLEDQREKAYNREASNLQAQQVANNQVTNALEESYNKLTGKTKKVPGNVYESIRDEALKSIKPINEGGEGLDPQQASRKYGEKLRNIDKQYNDLDAIGNWSITGKPAKQTLNQLKKISKDFQDREDSINFADNLIGNHSISPWLAYSIANPISNHKQINNALKKIPNISKGNNIYGLDPKELTIDVSEALFPLLTTSNISPLAVGWELKKKGYDPEIWKSYVSENANKLKKLTQEQLEELNKSTPYVNPWNDMWLEEWTGIK